LRRLHVCVCVCMFAQQTVNRPETKQSEIIKARTELRWRHIPWGRLVRPMPASWRCSLFRHRLIDPTLTYNSLHSNMATTWYSPWRWYSPPVTTLFLGGLARYSAHTIDLRLMSRDTSVNTRSSENVFLFVYSVHGSHFEDLDEQQERHHSNNLPVCRPENHFFCMRTSATVMYDARVNWSSIVLVWHVPLDNSISRLPFDCMLL